MKIMYLRNDVKIKDFYKLFSWCQNIRIGDNELSEQGIIQLFHGSEDNRLFKKIRFP